MPTGFLCLGGRGATRALRVLLLVGLLAFSLILSSGCSSDDRDRTGTIGNEQGDLDRDVEEFEVDPRPEPPGPGG